MKGHFDLMHTPIDIIDSGEIPTGYGVKRGEDDYRFVNGPVKWGTTTLIIGYVVARDV